MQAAGAALDNRRTKTNQTTVVCLSFVFAIFVVVLLFNLVPNLVTVHEHDEAYFYDLSDRNQITCLTICIVMSAMSILGSCLIFISYLGLRYRGETLSSSTFDKTSNAAPTEVVLLLSVSSSDLISGLSKLFTSTVSLQDRMWLHDENRWCSFLGFWEQFGTFATALWTLCIAIYLYRTIILKEGSEGWLLGFQFVSWGLPCLTATIALFQGFNGSSGMWCWIVETRWQWVFFYNFVVAIFVAILGIYMRIFCHVRSHSFGTMSARMKRRQRTTYMRLMFFPLAFLITWAGALCWRLDGLSQGNESKHLDKYWLFVYTSITLPSQGWLNAIAWYWFNKSKINHMYGEWFANIRDVIICHTSGFKNRNQSAHVPFLRLSGGTDGIDDIVERAMGEPKPIKHAEMRTRLSTEEFVGACERMEDEESDYLPPAFQAAIQFQTLDQGER